MRQKLGQHFLINQKILQSIAEEFSGGNFGTIIEIGPGHGELTKELIKNTECKIIAIERDPELAEELNNNFGEEKRLEIIAGDALKKIEAIVLNLKQKNKTYAITGNIPYYITGYLIRIIGELDFKPIKIVLTIQKEVAERIIAEPPEMNRLSAAVQFWAEPKITRIIKKEEFKPKPKVDSAIITLEIKSGAYLCDPQTYDQAINAIFKQPRKNILNNLSENMPNLDKNWIEQELSKLGISPKLRPQNLSVLEIIKIAQKILKK